MHLSSMNGGTRLLERMRLAEGLDLHALLVDARARRHAGGVALEVADRPDHLPREADVRHRGRVAVAELAGFFLALEVSLDGLQPLERPVREPLVASGLVELQLFLH